VERLSIEKNPVENPVKSNAAIEVRKESEIEQVSKYIHEEYVYLLPRM
jgi:hypothetical protein